MSAPPMVLVSLEETEAEELAVLMTVYCERTNDPVIEMALKKVLAALAVAAEVAEDAEESMH